MCKHINDILKEVWQTQITPGEAIEELKDALPKKPSRELSKNELVVEVWLKAVIEQQITIEQCEETIRWLLDYWEEEYGEAART